MIALYLFLIGIAIYIIKGFMINYEGHHVFIIRSYGMGYFKRKTCRPVLGGWAFVIPLAESILTEDGLEHKVPYSGKEIFVSTERIHNGYQIRQKYKVTYEVANPIVYASIIVDTPKNVEERIADDIVDNFVIPKSTSFGDFTNKTTKLCANKIPRELRDLGVTLKNVEMIEAHAYIPVQEIQNLTK